MEVITTPEREEYIKKLERSVKAIDKIMQGGDIATPGEKEELRKHKDKANKLLKKLKNDEFEIAIVGLEKAGKSTFANALMQNDLLPTQDARCTFTSTQIEYSGDNSDDGASVSFYDRETFNEDFKDKLSKLGIPNAKTYSFDTMSKDEYIRIYENDVTDDKKKIYGDSVNEDILAIIENKDSLSSLLGQPVLNFNADRVNSGELQEYITNEAKARAVRQVVIRSKKLNKMKNAIIFDVPGFNSPTELHKVQTKNRMDVADAIIVVANGVSPSLTGESLKILRESDKQGDPLIDKLFVFANKTEGARDIGLNVQKTYDEWTSKHFIADANKTKRIFFGSALSYLQDKGIDPDNRVLKQFLERKSEMPQGFGIDEIRKALEDYNHNERFAVLKRRVNSIQSSIDEIFRAIKERCVGNEYLGKYSEKDIAQIIPACSRICGKIEKDLINLRDEMKHFISENCPLTKKINEYIVENVQPDKYGITDEEIAFERKKSNVSAVITEVGRIESSIREEKFKKMYDDFSNNIINVADGYHDKYSDEILDIILRDMNVVKDSSPYYDELRKAVIEEISPYRIGVDTEKDYSSTYYQSVIERFSRSLYEVLINAQYNSERVRTFYTYVDDLFSMSVYYRNSNDNDDLSYICITPQEQPLCKMLLFHDFKTESNGNMEGKLTDFIKQTICCMDIRDDLKEAIKKTVSLSVDSIGDLIRSISSEAENWGSDSEAFKQRKIKNLILEYTDKKADSEIDMSDREKFTRYYDEYHVNRRDGKELTIEDVCTEFNKDIDTLRDVLLNASVRAINIERPFVTREDKSISDIIDKCIKSDRFSEFLGENYGKIEYKKAEELSRRQNEIERKKGILADIQTALEGSDE